MRVTPLPVAGLITWLIVLVWLESPLQAGSCCSPQAQRPRVVTSCISPGQRQRIDQRISAYERAKRRSGQPVRAAGGPAPYSFYPVAGNLGQDLNINNYVDLDPGPQIRDWNCYRRSYDGHNGHDSDHGLWYCEKMAVGIPVYAALDGTVIDAHDGEFDAYGCDDSVPAGQPANYVVLDHGGGHHSLYFHLKKNSVAVTAGQTVKAGTHLGLVGSSGNSSRPHLHWETRVNNIVQEPFSGPCRSGGSGWVQQPIMPLTATLMDVAVTEDGQRQGTVVQGSRLVGLTWAIASIPPNSSFRLRYQRPDGSFALDGQAVPHNNPELMNISFWLYHYQINLDTTGTWHLLLEYNGRNLVTAPFEVVASAADARNRAPLAFSVEFDPPNPTRGDVVFCRNTSSPALRDPDYDLVRYRYLWTVNGNTIRDVTSAALSDAIPHGLVTGGDALRCTVTPSDGSMSGSSAQVQEVIGSQGFTVRGTITQDGNGVAGVEVTAGTITATTGSDGRYVLSGLPAGNYDVIPSKPGTVFTPSVKAISVGPDQAGVDFTGAPEGFTLQGTVLGDGAGLGGVTVTAGGKTVTTGPDGTYVIAGLSPGTYTVTPSLTGVSFSPATRTVSLGPDRAGVDFTALVYSIRGTVLEAGTGLAGVTVAAGGQSATTDNLGAYVLRGLPPGTYTVQPSKTEYGFTPQTRAVTVGPSATGVDFSGTRSTYTIQGRVTDAGQGLANVTLQAGGTFALTDGDGFYTLSGLPAGTYRITPVKSRFAFSPAFRSITVGPDAGGVNFSGLQGFDVRGRVMEAGRGVSGVPVTAGGTTVTTGPDGTYSIGLPAGTYSVTPDSERYVFSPASRSVTVGPDATNVDFSATRVYEISGQITVGGTGLAGVTVSTPERTVTTRDDGSFTISGLSPGTYTVTPSHPLHAFNPPSRTVAVGPDQARVDFVGERPYVISGRVTHDGEPVSEVRVSGGGTSATTGTDGRYTLRLATEGTYTIRPSKAGLTFTPPSHAVRVGPDQSGVDFAVTPPTSVTLATLTLGRSSVRGGQGLGGSVTLTGAAPPGTVLTLRSSSTAVLVPAGGIAIASGETQGRFTLRTQRVRRRTRVTLTATLGGVSKTVTVMLRP